MTRLSLILMLLAVLAAPLFAELPAEVDQRLNAALEAEWGEGQVQYSVESTPPLGDLARADRWDLETGSRPRGLAIIQLVLWEDDRILKRIPVRLRVMPFAWVPVAVSPVERGQLLSAADLRWERREVTTLRHGWPESPDDLAASPLRARSRLVPGDVLTWRKVETAPAVQRGAPVKLMVRRGSVLIETEGIALEDGLPGEMIRVEQTDLATQLKAEVTGRNTANVLGVLSN